MEFTPTAVSADSDTDDDSSQGEPAEENRVPGSCPSQNWQLGTVEPFVEGGAVKVVILSDIHANYAALRALHESLDELWIAGDLVNYGPKPKEVIAWVREHAHVVVRGNHDHAIGFSTDPRCSEPYKLMAAETAAHTSSVLDVEEKRYLECLPLSAERRLGKHSFYICHAAPSDPLFAYKSKDDMTWAAEVESTDVDVVVVGHTHVPFVQGFKKQQIINPGSIGQPKTGSPEACYGVWEDGKLALKRYSYALEDTIAEIQAMPISEETRENLSFVLRTGGNLRGGDQ